MAFILTDIAKNVSDSIFYSIMANKDTALVIRNSSLFVLDRFIKFTKIPMTTLLELTMLITLKQTL